MSSTELSVLRAIADARFVESVVLPTPPFWPTTARTVAFAVASRGPGSPPDGRAPDPSAGQWGRFAASVASSSRVAGRDTRSLTPAWMRRRAIFGSLLVL